MPVTSVFPYWVTNMNVDYLASSIIIFALTLYLSKYLRATKSTFIIPSSADLAVSISLLSILLLSKVSTLFILIMSVILSAILVKVGQTSHAPLLIKVIGYSTALLIIPYISYEMYSYVTSLVTGFLYLTPETVSLLIVDAILLLIYLIFDIQIAYSFFDKEFSEIIGLKPSLWVSLVLFGAVIVGFTMTFMYGFLIAHILALSATNIKNRKLGIISFTVFTSLLIMNIPAALAVALGSVLATVIDKMLLLWKGSNLKVSKVRKAVVRKALGVPGV